MAVQHTPSTEARHFKDLRGVPHYEIVFITKDADGPGGKAVCYNTLGVTEEDFDDQFRALDGAALTAEFEADGIWLNGPRRAQMDEATAEIYDGGEVTSVGGIPMWIVAKFPVADLRSFAGERPVYSETPVRRTTKWLFRAGRPVHELVAPAGGFYVMQSCSLLKDQNLVEQLPTLGDRLQLPDGWEYRVRVLDEDLEVRAEDGVARVVLDEFENNYQGAH